MARARPTLGFEYQGPFFQRDPSKTFRQNVRVYMARVASISEGEVRRRMMSGGAEGAATAPHVVGRTHSISGRQWAVTARVSVSTSGLDGSAAVRRMAIAAGRHTSTTRTGRVIGTTRGGESRTHAFRDASKAITDAAQANVDKLLEGLN